jgi:hypothetical protein
VQFRQLLCEESDELTVWPDKAWPELTKEKIFLTVATQVQPGALAADFARFVDNSIWDRSTGRQVYGPLSPQQWQLEQSSPTFSSLYYGFRLRGTDWLMTPTPSVGETIAYEYVSNLSVYKSTDSVPTQDHFQADTDRSIFPETILARGVRWRFLRAKGMPYSQEYQVWVELVQRHASRDGGMPKLNLQTGGSPQDFVGFTIPQPGSGGGGTVTQITAGNGLIAFAGNPITVTGTLAIDTAVVATQSNLTAYALLQSPTFIGDPKAPTPAIGDNDTSIATTAWVNNQGYLPSAAVGGYMHWAPYTGTGQAFNNQNMTRDGDWTMVANKNTTARPAPQPSGSEEDLLPVWTPTTSSANAGYTLYNEWTLSTAGWINQYGADVIAQNVNAQHVITLRVGGVTKDTFTATPNASGIYWHDITPLVVASGSVIRVSLQVNQPPNNLYWYQQVNLFSSAPVYCSGAVGSKDGAVAGTTAYGCHLLFTPGAGSPDWDVVAFGGAAAGGGAGVAEAPLDGTTYGRLNAQWTPVLPLTGGTLTGNLLFSADNTVDIGASAATRPRSLYVGSNGTFGGSLTTATGITNVNGPITQQSASITRAVIGGDGNGRIALGRTDTTAGTVQPYFDFFTGAATNDVRLQASAINQFDIQVGGAVKIRQSTTQTLFNQNIVTTGSVGANIVAGIPAGGSLGTGFIFSNVANFGMFYGSGVPTIAAAQGSLYLRSDGNSTSTRAYINTNGSTGWTAITTAT